ncbi:UNVERIFIED_ASMBLY: DNA primase [Shigella phage 2019SD1]|uniref:DNA primase n=1 Tax=Shigella phage 2019SD1 TaxID=2848074 RepID=A0A6M5CEI8_9CAUD|nr:DNA primase [Shigella phage 2019SD1]
MGLFIDEEGKQSFLAKDYTRGSVVRTGNTDKTIYLCVDWIDAQHIHLATGQEVWACFDATNIEIVAYRYKGNRRMRVVCKSTDRDAIIAAEERGLEIMMPINDNYRQGIDRKVYKPESLLKLTGEPYSEVINILGRFLGKVPQDYRIKANKRVSRDSGYSFGKQASHECCERVMSKTLKFDRTPLSTYEGIYPPEDGYYECGVKDGRYIHALPCYRCIQMKLMMKCAMCFSLMKKVNSLFPHCGGKDRFRWTDKLGDKKAMAVRSATCAVMIPELVGSQD